METTNSMAVNSSNHLFIGMVSLLIHVQWPKSRHSISEIYLVIHIVGITKIYHHQLQFFAKISWNQLLRCFHEFFSKVRVNFSFFHTVKSTKIIITPPLDHSNHDKDAGKPLPEEKIFKDDELVNMIDPILATDDKNGDGFIDYKEFVLAQQAAATRQEHA